MNNEVKVLTYRLILTDTEKQILKMFGTPDSVLDLEADPDWLDVEEVSVTAKISKPHITLGTGSTMFKENCPQNSEYYRYVRGTCRQIKWRASYTTKAWTRLLYFVWENSYVYKPLSKLSFAMYFADRVDDKVYLQVDDDKAVNATGKTKSSVYCKYTSLAAGDWKEICETHEYIAVEFYRGGISGVPAEVSKGWEEHTRELLTYPESQKLRKVLNTIKRKLKTKGV